METVQIDLGPRSYSIFIENGLLDLAGTYISRTQLPGTAAIVTNTTVAPLYGQRLMASLAAARITATLIVLPDGEQYKNLNQMHDLYCHLVSAGLDRTSLLIALGGGVIGDMTGFAAATYMRGLSFVQVPTTLLAQVDSSVGGKTGVNLPEGKNLVGSFHQPRMVLIDPLVLKTLPERELKSGFAEVIKTAIIKDAPFFSFLQQNFAALLQGDSHTLTHCIATCCHIKARITSQDETEQGIRAFLNFGHTLGHALEALTGYATYTHGEAVAMGMAAIARISTNLGYCTSQTQTSILELIEKSGLPVTLPDFSVRSYVEAILKDKKKVANSVNTVLLKAIGTVFLREMTGQELTSILTNILPKRG